MPFFERNKGKIVLIAVTVLLVLVMALSAIPSAKPNFVSNAVGVVISPVQKVISKCITSTQGFFSFIFNMDKYETENKQLAEKIAVLEKEIRETEELKKENSRLRAMLEMRERTVQYETEAAEVIAKEASNWFNAFTVDKGTADGVATGNPVITSKGLVGYVSEAGTTYSKVVSLIDSTASVAAVVKRTGDSAVIEGDLKLQEQGLCRMVYINKNSVITAGDDLETSGMGGIYPRGIYIGKIKEVSADGTGLSQQAIIEPAVNFDSVSEVFIITGIK
ncbi:MAG: rod shape-determining protein MreC [Ruminococcaceae bacterium]|nr:rod shape-determining protein MreC [Oscillospiraceae bacterium]